MSTTQKIKITQFNDIGSKTQRNTLGPAGDQLKKITASYIS